MDHGPKPNCNPEVDRKPNSARQMNRDDGIEKYDHRSKKDGANGITAA
jgi:hypothetical protein